MRRAYFIVDDEHGSGHLVRSRALAAELTSRGWGVETTNQMGRFGESDVIIVDGQQKWPSGYDARIAAPIANVIIGILDVPEGLQGWNFVVCGTSHDGAWGRSCDLIGPRYALLRPEFRTWRLRDVPRETPLLDVRFASDWSSTQMAEAMRRAKVVLTYPGMRAIEAHCCGAELALAQPRNAGETLNAIGLLRQDRPEVDGLGCVRVADRIEAVCRG